MLTRGLALLPFGILLLASTAAADTEWVDDDDDGLHIEVSHSIGMGAIFSEQPPSFAGTVEIGLVGYLDRSFARDSNPIPGLMIGDTLGLAARMTVLANGSQSNTAWAVAVGGSPIILDRLAGEIVRLPTLLGVMAPEVGVILRSLTEPALYLAWELPFALRMDDHVAVDIAVRVYAIDDWLAPRIEEPGVEPWEIMTTVSMGVRLIE